MQFTIDGLCSTKHQRVRSLDAASLTPSTLANTTKEELCLEYVDNFLKQFAELFPGRPAPFLVAPNEAGVPKFLSTTIRCTQLPFKELYGLEECASFISHFITYEPLANPLRVPEVIPSPAVVLNWRIGDSFDMAFVLCSFLLGNGYDAYVVVGKAPRWITLRDQRRAPCPYTPPRVKADEPEKVEEGDEDDGEDEVPSKYVASDKGVPKSKYELAMAERESKKQAAPKPDADAQDEDDEEPPPPADPLAGRRVHAWVLVRAGPREVEDHVFVEPSTGRVMPVGEAPYEAIDSVCSNTNCWVNMQPRTAPAEGSLSGMGPIAFDLDNTDNWEYVFIRSGGRAADADASKEGKQEGEMDLSAALNTKIDLSGGDTKDEAEEDTAHILDLPPSWVPQLELEREAVEQQYVGRWRCVSLLQPPYGVCHGCVLTSVFVHWLRYGPLNCCVTLFRKAKLELYAPDTHPRGLVARLFKFKDYERTLLVEQVEMFQKRADKLRKRVRYPLKRRVDEFFDSGRDHHLKRHSEVLGKWREMEFYATAHIDGLVRAPRLLFARCVWRVTRADGGATGCDACQVRRTEVIREKITEVFRGRVDHLTYRSVSLLPQGHEGSQRTGGRGKTSTKMGQFVLHVEPGDLAMRKMTQKFSRSPGVDADKDVAKRTYFVQDKTIREDYHYAEGRIMASSRVYHKDAPDGQHVELRFVNPFADTPKPSELDADFRRVVALEKECSHDIREATRLASEILWTRAQDELAIDIDKTIFDAAREKSAEDASKEAEEEEQKDRTAESKMDFLKPFLQKCEDPEHPTKEEAARADKECRKALKERLIERVNIIQRRLDEENAKLAKKQAAFQRSQREQLGEGAEEEFEQFCAEAMFKIGILEQRLQRQEETVLAKFTELEIMLKADPRLAELYGPAALDGSK